jgi:hypothetical protein
VVDCGAGEDTRGICVGCEGAGGGAGGDWVGFTVSAILRSLAAEGD